MKVLFCTDGSSISFNALENFSKWICTDYVEMDVISAIDWSFLPDEVSIEESGFVNSCADIASNILYQAQKHIEFYGMKPAEMVKVCGSAVESILEQLNKKDYDLILLGSHGRKGIQKWLGSVSRDILTNSGIPAYISKYKNEAKTILFPIDGSENSIEGVQYVIDNYDLRDKDITICMINEEPDMIFLEGNLDSNWLVQIEQNQKLYASKILTKVQNLFAENCYNISKSIILTGKVSEKIIDYTTKNKIDMVCLTSRNLPKFQKFLLGSISSRVLEFTTSDVLIYKI